jgi:hypothetical protein
LTPTVIGQFLPRGNLVTTTPSLLFFFFFFFSMPLDNKGEAFEYISITTLHATSEAIVQPLSRPYGFNRRLVYPMPHPYGAIGKARPADRLPINVGPRPGAPMKQKNRNPMF